MKSLEQLCGDVEDGGVVEGGGDRSSSAAGAGFEAISCGDHHRDLEEHDGSTTFSSAAIPRRTITSSNRVQHNFEDGHGQLTPLQPRKVDALTSHKNDRVPERRWWLFY